MEQVALTICIGTVPTRRQLLNRLLNCITPQLTPAIEVLIAGGTGPQGDKLNACFASAKGTYVVAVDDDDLLAPDFVESVAPHFLSGVDYIGYNILWMEDGIIQKSVPHKGDGDPLWSTYDDRGVCPKCLIKKEIATRHPYGNHYTADREWSQVIQKEVHSHVFVDSDLYIYDHWNNYALVTSPDAEVRALELLKPQRSTEEFTIDEDLFTWM